MGTSDLNATVEIKSGFQRNPIPGLHSNLSLKSGRRAHFRHP